LRRDGDIAKVEMRARGRLLPEKLRTPLKIILGYNDLLTERSFGPLTPEQADILRRVGRSGRELLELINATLDLSRLVTGRPPIDLNAVQLDALLRQIDRAARSASPARPASAPPSSSGCRCATARHPPRRGRPARRIAGAARWHTSAALIDAPRRRL
jgi:signal transduction histidine kinase